MSLAESGCLDVILSLDQFFIGPLALAECGDCSAGLSDTIDSGTLIALEVGDIPTARFLELLSEFRLGDGETEGMVVAERLGLCMATDDRKARKSARLILGPGRVTGSIGLLGRAVSREALAPADANEFYGRMVRAGSFLPKIDESFFQSLG